MKLRYWIIIWGALLTFCLVLGLSTRASYTEFSLNQDAVLNSYYNYSPGPRGISDVDYNKLSAKSQLIATCRFTGTRELQNKCCLSDIQISTVISGDNSLNGKTIHVYEPVYTSTENIDFYKSSKNCNQMDKKFNWQGKSNVIISCSAGGENQYNYTMMSENKVYLLFLNQKQDRPEAEYKSENKYVLVDSPYSKLTVNKNNANNYKTPEDLITLKESLQYEILLKNSSSIKTYFDTKEKILNQLKLI